MLDDEPKQTASEFVDFTYYGEVVPTGLDRPPRVVEEPRLSTLTKDTARALTDKKTLAACDEYLHIGCYAFFDSRANAAISDGLDARSNDPPLSPEQAAAVALIEAGNRTHGGGRPYSIGLPPPHRERASELRCGQRLRRIGTRTLLSPTT
jgi:hypothetical protein